MRQLLTTALFTLLFTASALADPYADAVAAHPERWQQVLDALDPDARGMKPVFAAAKAGRDGEALRRLEAHFEISPAGEPFRSLTWGPAKESDALRAMTQGTFTAQRVTRTAPMDAEGRIDWNWVPDDTSDQWTHFLNRFGHLSFLARAARDLGEPYRGFVNQYLRDWVATNPRPRPDVTEPDPGHPGGPYNKGKSDLNPHFYAWLGLNVGIRLEYWVPGFFQMLKHDVMEPETLVVMLASLAEQAEYLRLFHGFEMSNHGTTQMRNLLGLTNAFPEFKRGDIWAQAAAERYLASYEAAMQPDGSHWELATMYEFGVLKDTLKYVNMLEDGGHPVPPRFYELLGPQADYQAWAMTPDGKNLPAGDSDPDVDIRDVGADVARDLKRPEALYLFTDGAQGTAPAGPPSRFFGYAGNLFGFDRLPRPTQKYWFDAGPYGVSHQHADKLALTVWHRRPLLVDPGRYTYSFDGGWYPDYFVHTRGHNAVSIDGGTQPIYPAWRERYRIRENLVAHDLVVDEPLGDGHHDTVVTVADDHDAAVARTVMPFADKFRDGTSIPGQAVHERAVHYERGKFWLVVDRVFTDRPRKVEAFWHLHPDVETAAINPSGALITRDAGASTGNLAVFPVAGRDDLSNGTLVRGQEKPVIQGWYSPKYNTKVPAFAATYEARVEAGVATFAWLILPYEGPDAPDVSAEFVSNGEREAVLRVNVGGKPVEVTVPLGEVPGFEE